MELGADLLELIPIAGKALAKTFKTISPLIDTLVNENPKYFNHNDYKQDEDFNCYKIKTETMAEGNKIVDSINGFCSPHIQRWWLDTQDELIREGTKIRVNLVEKIRTDIQEISNELSEANSDN